MSNYTYIYYYIVTYKTKQPILKSVIIPAFLKVVHVHCLTST